MYIHIFLKGISAAAGPRTANHCDPQTGDMYTLDYDLSTLGGICVMCPVPIMMEVSWYSASCTLLSI